MVTNTRDIFAYWFYNTFCDRDLKMTGASFIKNRPPHIINIINFLGLPLNPDLVPSEAKYPTWGTIIKSFLGWPPANPASSWKRFFRFLAMPFITVWHLLLLPLKPIWNTLRLVTEFLPICLVAFSLLYLNKPRSKGSPGRTPATIFLSLLLYFSVALLWLGKAITSPVDNIKDMYYFGRVRHRSHFLGVALALLSIAASATIYTFLFPLIIQAIAVNLPTLTAAVSDFLVTQAPWLINIGNGILSSPVVQGLSRILVGSVQILVGTAAVLSLGSLAILFIEQSIRSLYHCCKRPKKIGVNTDVDPESYSENIHSQLKGLGGSIRLVGAQDDIPPSAPVVDSNGGLSWTKGFNGLGMKKTSPHAGGIDLEHQSEAIAGLSSGPL